jgi:hypothetical protein
MAIIYSYPSATPTLQDHLLGVKNETEGLPTKLFGIAEIVQLAVNEIDLTGFTGSFTVNGTAVPGGGLGVYEISIINGLIKTITLVG